MPALTRRQALATMLAAAAAGAAGCRDAGRPTPQPPSSAPPGPIIPPAPEPLVAVLDAERGLLAAYDATARTHPALAARLAPLRADHAEHALALELALGRSPASSPPVPASPSSTSPNSTSPNSTGPNSTSPSSTGPASSSPASSSPYSSSPASVPDGGEVSPLPLPPVPHSRAGALAALRSAEHAAAAAQASAAETAPADRAVLLASVAACEASHEVLLR